MFRRRLTSAHNPAGLIASAPKTSLVRFTPKEVDEDDRVSWRWRDKAEGALVDCRREVRPVGLRVPRNGADDVPVLLEGAGCVSLREQGVS